MNNIDQIIADIWRPHWRKKINEDLGIDTSELPDDVIDNIVESYPDPA